MERVSGGGCCFWLVVVLPFCFVDSDFKILMFSKWGRFEELMFSFRGTEKWRVYRKEAPSMSLPCSLLEIIECPSGKVGIGLACLSSSVIILPMVMPYSLPAVLRHSSMPASCSFSICANLRTRLLNSCEILATSRVCDELGAIRVVWAR